MFEQDLKNNLYRIWNRMSSGTYLEPDVEPQFHPDSYGYRPRKSAIDALTTARQRCWRYDWVIDLDILGFFDNLDHALVMRAVRKYTRCRWILLYVQRWVTGLHLAGPGEKSACWGKGLMRGADIGEVVGLLSRILAVLEKAPAERDPRDVVIEQQDREVGRLRDDLTRHKGVHRENGRLHRQNDGLQRQNERLRRENEHLRQQLGAERRAGRRQAAPFAKDRPQGRGGRPGRRPGARYGRQGRRPCPARVDETLAAPAPATCPDCGGAVEVTGAASQYQEDLPPVRPLVRRFDIEVDHCSACRRRIQGRHALQTSDALGAARAQLGPGVVALVVELHTHGGLPLAKVADLLQTRFGLHVTPGGLANLLHRAARDARPAYEELREQVRNSPVVTADETGWRVGALGHWLWAAVTPTTTVYAICPGRGFDDAQTVLGADFDGVLVRDGWVVYRRYTHGEHQSCLQHLLRRCEHLHEDHPHSGWAGQVQDTLQAGLALRDRRNAGGLSDHGLATARGRLLARLSRLIDNPPRLDDAERFAAHLAIEFPAIFTFSVGPVGRRHQLARRTSHPARRRHPQGVRRQPHPQGRRHTAGPRQRRTHRPPTQPRPARAVRHDVARRRPPRPRRIRASAAARVRGRAGTTALTRDRARRLTAAPGEMPRRCPEARPPAVWAGCSNGSCAPQTGRPCPPYPGPVWKWQAAARTPCPASCCGWVTVQPRRHPA